MPQPNSAQTRSSNPIEQWIEKARDNNGGGEAIGRALEACQQYLLLVADRELGDDLRPKVGASDLVQETFLDAQRDFRRFQGRTEGELRAWLRRILKNNLANHAEQYRRTAKRQLGREVSLDNSAIAPIKMELKAETVSPSVQMLQQERADALHRALQRLPERYRQVIEWRHRQGCSFGEIGRRLENSADAARKIWSRALQHLQVELADVEAHGG
jgi:RNA polymerase sigma-70 factor (ECF subfamily)